MAHRKRNAWVAAVALMAAAGVSLWAFNSPMRAPNPPGVAAQAVRGEPLKAPADSIPAASASAADARPASDNASRQGAMTVGFDKLAAFQLRVTDDLILGVGDPLENKRTLETLIPDTVKTLDAKQVCVSGFMLPTQFRDGKASDFLLLKNQSACCYGIVPAINDYVLVRTAGSGVEPVMDRVITVSGTLRVGEIRQGNVLAGIYQLNADKVEVAKQP